MPVSLRAVCLIVLTALGSFTHADRFDFHHENVLGTSLHLRIEAGSSSTAGRAESHVLAEIDRLAAIFSSYDSSSELSQFQKLPTGSSTKLSDDLFDVLRQCDEWTRVSRGAFNPAVEALSRMWKQAESGGVPPSPTFLSDLAGQVSAPQWRLDLTTREATRCSSLPITLNAIAKGVILDRVAESTLDSSADVHGVMIDIGGDVRVAGAIETVVSIADPRKDALGASATARCVLSQGAMATSGNSERGMQIKGRRYSHLIDPRSGRPVTEIISSTVVASQASTADVLATICCVLPIGESLRLVNSIPGAKCLLISSSGVTLASDDWPDREPAVRLVAKASRVDEPAYSVEFEIKRAEDSRRYRRPYVAVWIEDKDGYPVKTLSLFLMQNQPGPRWYRDLRRWYTDDQMRRMVDKTDLIDVVSKPTRNPGKYTVTWDGRDDAGRPLENGDYTLLIEAAREHGSYQLIKHKFSIGSEAFEVSLKGNQEISTATFRYTE